MENNKEYKDIKNEIKDFIINYNSIENKDEKINELILKYENVPNVIKENNKTKKTNLIKYSIIGIIVIFIIIIKKKVKNEKIKRINRL